MTLFWNWNLHKTFMNSDQALLICNAQAMTWSRGDGPSWKLDSCSDYCCSPQSDIIVCSARTSPEVLWHRWGFGAWWISRGKGKSNCAFAIDAVSGGGDGLWCHNTATSLSLVQELQVLCLQWWGHLLCSILFRTRRHPGERDRQSKEDQCRMISLTGGIEE